MRSIVVFEHSVETKQRACSGFSGSSVCGIFLFPGLPSHYYKSSYFTLLWPMSRATVRPFQPERHLPSDDYTGYYWRMLFIPFFIISERDVKKNADKDQRIERWKQTKNHGQGFVRRVYGSIRAFRDSFSGFLDRAYLSSTIIQWNAATAASETANLSSPTPAFFCLPCVCASPSMEMDYQYISTVDLRRNWMHFQIRLLLCSEFANAGWKRDKQLAGGCQTTYSLSPCWESRVDLFENAEN